MSESNATTLHAALLQLGVTTELEKSAISSNLNASMLLALFMGIYTVVYGGTMYTYFARVSSRSYIVPATVTVLFLCNLAIFGVQWDSTKWQFIDNGEDRDSLFLSFIDAPLQLYFPAILLDLVALVLGDGLLIWRCFNVWNRSFRIIFIPVLLVIAETALLLAQLIGATKFFTSTKRLRFNKVSAAGYIIGACTTILTTTLIAYRIHSFLKEKAISSRKFRHIIDIVVQSGAAYSLSVLVLGISGTVTNNNVFPSAQIYGLAAWSQCFVFPISGISTTLMVARVATIGDDPNPSTSVHLSGLQFRPRSTARTGSSGAQVTVDIPGDGDIGRLSSNRGQVQAQNLDDNLKLNQKV